MVTERREFLTSLGATNKEEYVAPVERKRIVDLREKRGQFTGIKYRVKFSKVGPLSFISHLDTQKIMARIFKRAEVEILFSEGFKRRPLISFGPALTLGISSLSEYFDVRVPSEWSDPEAILSKLQSHSERGIIFKHISKVENKTPSIQEAADAFTYFVPLKGAQSTELAVSAISSAKKIEVSSYSKKDKQSFQKDIREKIVDVKSGKLDLSRSLQETINEVSPCLGDGLFVTTKLSQGSGVRPSELNEMFRNFGFEVERPIKVETLLK